LYAPLGPLSPIGSLLLVKFIEVATAEPKFEEPPAIRIKLFTISKQTELYPQSQKIVIVCIPLSEQEKEYDLSFQSEGACMHI